MIDPEKPIHSIRPSKSQPPGYQKVLSTIMVDPWFLVFRLVAVIVNSVTEAVLKHRESRKREKGE
jgi:hypothetical protein